MLHSIARINDTNINIYSLNTVIVGSGAAGLNAADRLYSLGQRDIAIVTEGLYMGTSRNTGSDKQTYYKLTLAEDKPDSVYDMARTLSMGQHAWGYSPDRGLPFGTIFLSFGGYRCPFPIIVTGICRI